MLHGVPKVSPSVESRANDYLTKYLTKDEACKADAPKSDRKMYGIRFCDRFWRDYYNAGYVTCKCWKCIIYVQMRRIACAAYMNGYELNSDQTQTFVYACLAGAAVNELIKQAGIKLGIKFANRLIKKISG